MYLSLPSNSTEHREHHFGYVYSIIVHRQIDYQHSQRYIKLLKSVNCPTPRQSNLQLHVRHVKKVFRADTFAGSFPNKQARPSVGEKLKSSQDGLIHRHYD